MNRIWMAIILAGVGTYAMRAAFIVAASRMSIVPIWAERILRQIPPAALAALVLPALVQPEGHLDFWQPRLYLGILAALVAWRTNNTALTLTVGLVGLTIVLTMV